MKNFIKNKYKSIVCILLGMFLLTQVSNAYAHFWWGAMIRTLFGQTVKQGVKKTASRTAFGHLTTAVNVAGVASVVSTSGTATASDYYYNEHGAVLVENGYRIYLGRGCEAESYLYGKGQWGWNSQGFVVALNNGEETTVLEYSKNMRPDFPEYILNACKVNSSY